MPEASLRNYSKVTFLLGAGASVDAGCPTVEGLVQRFDAFLQQSASPRQLECAREIQKLIASSDGVTQGRQSFDIELFLSTIVQLMERDKSPLQPFIRQWHRSVGANKALLADVLGLLQDHIREECTVKSDSVDYLGPLKNFADLYGTLDIFSLNYDAGIEIMCQQRDVRYTDGFDLYWNPIHFESDAFKIRLFKLHGSLLWYETGSRPKKLVKIPVHPTSGSDLSFFTEEKVANLLMYPAFVKRQHVEPYATLMNHFQGTLRQSRVIVAIGCSFRDEYLKELVIEKMIENPDLQLVVVDPNGARALALSDVNVNTDLKFSSVAAKISFVHEKAATALAGGLLLDHVRQVEELPDLKLAHEKAVLSGEDRRIQTDLGTPTGVAYAQRLIATRNIGNISSVVSDTSDPFQLTEILTRIVTRTNPEGLGGGNFAAVAILFLALSPGAETRLRLTEWLERKLAWVIQYVVWLDEAAYRTNRGGVPTVQDARTFFNTHAERVRDFEADLSPWISGMRFHLSDDQSSVARELLRDVGLCGEYFERCGSDTACQWFRSALNQDVNFPRSRDDQLMRQLAARFGERWRLSMMSLLGPNR